MVPAGELPGETPGGDPILGVKHLHSSHPFRMRGAPFENLEIPGGQPPGVLPDTLLWMKVLTGSLTSFGTAGISRNLMDEKAVDTLHLRGGLS